MAMLIYDRKYALQIHHSISYYTLIAVQPTTKIQHIHLNIHKLLKWCKSTINCTDRYYIKQWTDLMKIKTILTDESKRMEYNKVHSAAMVSTNNDLYVKFL